MPFDGSAGGFLQRLRLGYNVPSCSTKAAVTRGDAQSFAKLREHRENSAPPYRCLRRTVDYLCSRTDLPNEGLVAIKGLTEILDRGFLPDTLLDFALAVYFDEDVLQRMKLLMVEALERIDSSDEGGENRSLPPLPVLLHHWGEDSEAFSKWCEEVGEAYVYFVFLDIKGDRALLTPAVKQLQQLLEVDIDGLVANLSSTRHWARLVWRDLASRGRSQTLQRIHVQFLQQWLSSAKEAAVTSLSEIGGRTFWDVYFSGLNKVSWYDFVDGLQEQFLKDFCAQDLLEPLRRRVAKSKQHVQRYQWECLLDTYKHSVPDLLDDLLEEALKDSAALVYREKPLFPDGTGARARREEMTEFFTPSTWQSAHGTHPSCGTHGTGEESWTLQPMTSLKPTLSSDALVVSEHSATAVSLASGRTPQDPRMRAGPTHPGDRLEWHKFVEELSLSEARWWSVAPDHDEEDALREAAVAAVRSSLHCTRHALLLRVASGDLAHNRPVLELPSGHGNSDQSCQLPAVFISPNIITSTPGVTKLGRGSKRKMMLPDLFMNEPIASRSHLAISYDADAGRYQIMDTGSKWGTFIQVKPEGEILKCGDWIRVGNAELVVRFCGGYCKASRCHRQRGQRMSAMSRSLSSSALLQGSMSTSFPRSHSMTSCCAWEQADNDDLNEQISNVLSGRPRKAWDTPVDKMCQSNALSLHDERTGGPEIQPHSSSLPWAPLEIDFVSGPRMGERLLLTEQVCTIGRADTCTVQISDPMLANVSRKHCVLQRTASGWKIIDNKSTNGTWRRLSCVLEPSEPQDLQSGACILAGVHEFRIEEADLGLCWLPSPASTTLETLQKAAKPDWQPTVRT